MRIDCRILLALSFVTASSLSACSDDATNVVDDAGPATDMTFTTDMTAPEDMTNPQDMAVALDMAAPEDMALALDMAAPEDMAIAVDMAAPEDMAIAVDMATPEDMAIAVDMAMPEDMAIAADLGVDMAVPTCGLGFVVVAGACAPLWVQNAYVKASNTGVGDDFGHALALSADGTRLAVGANWESSNAFGVGGDQSNDAANRAGAVYLFVRTGTTWAQEAYVKAANTGANDNFGQSVSLSADGSRLAVGAIGEDSNATGINGSAINDAARESGAVYVFTRTGSSWAQEAYVKASNTNASDYFGLSVALSADGSHLAVGANGEDSNATGIGGDQTNNAATGSGAVYVYARTGTTWAQEAYVKASTAGPGDSFGYSVTLSSDGSRLAVSANGEDSNATGIGGDQANNAARESGAVYVFTRSGTTWTQEAYVKAGNTGARDEFGISVSLSADGNQLAVGAWHEDSSATGVGGDPTSDGAPDAGAVYVFSRTGTTWSQDAYLKASNTGPFDQFGWTLALSADGLRLAVGAIGEGSSATGVGGDQASNSTSTSGAVYVFVRTATSWAQEAYVKASNTGMADFFGHGVSLSSDGRRLAVGAPYEASNATGIDGDQTNDRAGNAGAAYVFDTRD